MHTAPTAHPRSFDGAAPAVDGEATATLVRRLLWRLHGWAGLIIAPLAVFAALTGLLYTVSPQIEAWRHAALDRVPVTGPAQPLDAQLAAAREAAPGRAWRSLVTAQAPGATTQVVFGPAGAGHAHGAADAAPAVAGAGQGASAAGRDAGTGLVVYVDPATARVVGSLPEHGRFKAWASRLHSSALQGDAWRWPLELAASWMLVLLASGLWSWWPAARARGWRVLLPRPAAGGGPRRVWRDWHATLGVSAAGVLALILVTGLTWSTYSGDNFRSLQRVLGQGSPRPPPGLGASPASGPVLDLQAVHDAARRAAPDLPAGLPLQLNAPRGPGLPWRVDVQVRGRPTARLGLVLDAHSGTVLWRAGWDDLPLLAKATAVGIPFHRGELGLWNQLLLAVLALAVLASTVSGCAMWWLRRPARRSAPAAPDRRAWPLLRRLWRTAPARHRWPAVIGVVALGLALPVFGLSLLAAAGVEALLALRGPRTA